MGKYDDLVSDLSPAATTKYGDLLGDIGTTPAKPAAKRKLSPKDLAQISGLGFMGKNLTSETLVDPKAAFNKYGSYYPTIGLAFGGPAGAGIGQIIKNSQAQVLGDDSAQTDPLRAGAEAAFQTGTAGVLETPMAKAAISGAVNLGQKALNPVGRFLSKVGEGVTGVPAQSFQKLAKDPTALFIPRSLKQAGKRFGQKLKDLGINIKPTISQDFDPQLTSARRGATQFFKKLEDGVETMIPTPTKVQVPLGIVSESGAPLMTTKTVVNQVPAKLPFRPDAGEIIQAKRNVDDLIEGTSRKQADKLRRLYKRKNTLTDLLEKTEGKAQEASREYARSALASQFRKVLAETQTGKIAFVRNVMVPLLTRTFALPAASSPAVAGLVTSLGSMGGQAAKQVAMNPQYLIAKALSSKFEQKKGK